MKPLSLDNGGMGPQATAIFMERVIQHTKAKCDQDHIDMVVLNHASLPDRTDAVRSGQGGAFLEEVRQDFKLLELARVANIAIPCNTSHYYYQEMQRMTRIPIIHMVDETIRRIHDRYGAGMGWDCSRPKVRFKAASTPKLARSTGFSSYFRDLGAKVRYRALSTTRSSAIET